MHQHPHNPLMRAVGRGALAAVLLILSATTLSPFALTLH